MEKENVDPGSLGRVLQASQDTLRQWKERYRCSLSVLYDGDEAGSIFYWAAEEITGMPKAVILAEMDYKVTEKERSAFAAALQKLRQGEPVQYVFGKAYFAGLELNVGPGVLIPRPETEELFHWASESLRKLDVAGNPCRIMDLCTGSGALALALASAFPDAEVYACDLSTEALSIAGKNAVRLNLPVCFFCHDVLEGKLPASVTEGKDFHLMVSNPPYVLPSEKPLMHLNVIGYEPNMALFVKETDPLAFYRALAVMARSCLQPGGFFLAEINEAFPQENISLLAEAGFVDVEVRKDFRGKCRMIRGRQPFEAI